MKRKAVFFSIGIITALLTLVSGCGSNNIGESLDTTGVSTGRLIVKITDAPGEFDRVMLTITGLQVHKAGTEDSDEQEQSEDKGGWIDLELVNAVDGKLTFNLLDYQNGLQKMVAVSNLGIGKYTQIRMEVESVGLDPAGGDTALTPATLPSGSLKFIQPFDLVAGQDTELLFDIDALKSVHKTGKDDYMFKPVIKLDVVKNPVPTLLITTEDLNNGIVGAIYSDTIDTTGGKAPLTWNLDTGSAALPAGLTLNAATGAITGTIGAAVVPGDFPITVKVQDSAFPKSIVARDFIIKVTAALQITTTSLPDGIKDAPYAPFNLVAVGGNGVYTWSPSSPVGIPNGLTISASGVVSGTPTADVGDYSFTVQVTDSSAVPQTDSQVVTIHINAAP